MVEPPCTTFSIIRRPALRSRDAPYGHNPAEEKTRVGNVLGCRACQLMKVAGVNRVAGLLETTYSSMLKHLLAWHSVQNMACAKVVRVDSCRFGSPHLKSFRMLCVHLSPDHIDRQCICTCKHLQVQGKYTKGSATYTDQLSDALALDFAAWIFAERKALCEEADTPAKGLESLAVNDLAISGKWSVDCAWNFRKDSHINILEESALLRLAQRCASLKYPTRITAMVDSNVVRGASAKGRSSSLGLSTVLRRFNAVCVAAALYFSIPFCPTRHNPSDDPTRDTPLRCSLPGLDFLEMDRDSKYDLCQLPKLKRWASNWARLILRLSGRHTLYLSRRDLFRRSFISRWFPQSKIFDSSLGFPGEGPLLLCLLWTFQALIWLFTFSCCFVGSCLLWPLGFRCSACWSRSFVVLVSLSHVGLGPVAMAMPIQPMTPAESRKAAIRRFSEPLAEGRPVLPATGSAREKFWKAFLDWASSESLDIAHLLDHPGTYVEEINAVICRYGMPIKIAAGIAMWCWGGSKRIHAKPQSHAPCICLLSEGLIDVSELIVSAYWLYVLPASYSNLVTTSLLWGWTRLDPLRGMHCPCLGFSPQARWAFYFEEGQPFVSCRHRKHYILPADLFDGAEDPVHNSTASKHKIRHSRPFEAGDFDFWKATTAFSFVAILPSDVSKQV